MTRTEFNLAAAKSNVIDGRIQIDFKQLADIATLIGYYGMDTSTKARKCFIEDIENVLYYDFNIPELLPALYAHNHYISLCVPETGLKDKMRVTSYSVAIGSKGYTYDCFHNSNDKGYTAYEYDWATDTANEHELGKVRLFKSHNFISLSNYERSPESA
jgi:hypothetical protein